MYKIFRYTGLALAAAASLLTACGDDYPSAADQPYGTDILSIQVVNTGANGTTVLDGTVDEYNKMINFPRMDVATNFAALKVEAKLSDGAALESNIIDCSMADDEASKTITIRVTNHKRYKDYFFRVRKDIPVYGADFDKVKLYDFEGYTDFVSLSTRSADFDGSYVLVVSRKTQPHVLKFDDLKAGTVSPINLNITGVSGGTYAYSTGALVNGHIYICNLSTSVSSPLKIYYWDTPTSAPETLASIDLSSVAGVGARNGDNMSVNIDAAGNGFIYFGDNAGKKVLRVTVTNHKTIGSPTVFNEISTSSSSSWMNIYRIGDTDEYMYSTLYSSMTLADGSCNVKYTMSGIPAQAIAARVVFFNNERYLITGTAGRTAAVTSTFYLFNITKGEKMQEALQIFDASSNHNPEFSRSFGSGPNSAPNVSTNYYIEKDADGNDSKLYLFCARADSGFFIAEFPIKTQDD
jgi:hypothetical protein